MLRSVGLVSLMTTLLLIQEPQAVQPTSVQLPNGNSVWVVLVRRSGGFAGGSVTITVNSEKKLNCTACEKQPISRTLSENAFRSAIPSFTFGIPPIPDDVPRSQADLPPISFCQDCFSTHVTIQRRNADGKIETYAATWNDVTAGSAPAEFVKLANAILALAR